MEDLRPFPVKPLPRSYATLLALLLVVAAQCAAQSVVDVRVETSRTITAEFGSRLQSELLSAMGEGGPGAAIAVCRELAPQIASELSRASGAKVQRTSLKFRNAANAPEPWQSDVLQEFDRDAAQASQPDGLESLTVAGDGGLRYMKAIPTGELCLACHGSTVSAEIEAALDEHYPHDLARGYALGDVRGAFSVMWPVVSTDR